jgi:hypothetical protein
MKLSSCGVLRGGYAGMKDNVRMKLATAYDSGGKLYFHGYSKTTEGLWILAEPVLTSTENTQEVGRAVRECLAASREGVRHPQQMDWEAVTKPLLTLAGTESFDAFAKGAKGVQIAMEGEVITLIPLRNGGPRQGFMALEEKTQTITPGSDEELGAAVLGALAMAE